MKNHRTFRHSNIQSIGLARHLFCGGRRMWKPIPWCLPRWSSCECSSPGGYAVWLVAEWRGGLFFFLPRAERDDTPRMVHTFALFAGFKGLIGVLLKDVAGKPCIAQRHLRGCRFFTSFCAVTAIVTVSAALVDSLKAALAHDCVELRSQWVRHAPPAFAKPSWAVARTRFACVGELGALASRCAC